MARAKRTDRAEARRRYRAATAPEPIDGAATGEAGDQPGSTTGTSAATAARPTGAPAGSGMAWAFRAAFRPVHVRQDFESVPWIAVHTKALWVPVLITLASTVLVAVTGGNDMLSAFLYQYFILTPAIGGVFIAGFLAPRASWLLGVIVGLVAAACYSFLGLSGVVPIGPTVELGGRGRDLVRPVAARRRVLCRSGRLVSPVPRAIEPEPPPPAGEGTDAEEGRRPHAIRWNLAKGWRSPLTTRSPAVDGLPLSRAITSGQPSRRIPA